MALLPNYSNTETDALSAAYGDDGSEVQELTLLSALVGTSILARLFLERCQLEELADGSCRWDDLSRNNVLITHLSVTAGGSYRQC